MKKLIVYSGLAALFFSACFVQSSGNVSSGPLLNVKDKYVAVAVGESKAFSVFGIGGFKKDGLVLEAKMKMFMNRPLGEKEYYANISAGLNTKFILGFIVIRKVMVSADVLSQDENASLDKVAGNPLAKIGARDFFISKEDTFRLGEIVYGNFGTSETNFYKTEIMAINGNKMSLRYIDLPKPNVTVRNDWYRFFSASKTLHGFKCDDNVNVKSMEVKDFKKNGIVLGVSKKYVLVLTELGMDYYIPERLERATK